MDALYPYINKTALHRQLILPGGWSEPIRMLRGTPQGCPLSPFLFNLSVEPWLRAMEADKEWQGVRLSESVFVKSLAFADDTVLGIGRPGDLTRAMFWTAAFQRISGAQINWSTSCLWGMGPWAHKHPEWPLPPGLRWEDGPVK